MNMQDSTVDIIKTSLSAYKTSLKKVGMENVEIPIKLELKNASTFMQIAKCDLYVSLDNQATKGIHMSRLYILLEKEFEKTSFNISTLKNVLQNFLESHKDISEKAYLNVRYKHPVKCKSLKSNLESWKNYSVSYLCSYDTKGIFDIKVEFQILYSSTCPCSAALSRQLIQNQFKNSFMQDGKESTISKNQVFDWLGTHEAIAATPHSQRSVATFRVEPKDFNSFNLLELINHLESVITTPVQTVVKREDEQEFARLNGKNLIFAEDIAKRLKSVLIENKNIYSFDLKVSHLESLHAHDAVAYA